MLWDLVGRLRSQIRYVALPMGGLIATGWDMGAAMAMGRALGLPDILVADVLPDIEAVAVAQTNAQARGIADG